MVSFSASNSCCLKSWHVWQVSSTLGTSAAAFLSLSLSLSISPSLPAITFVSPTFFLGANQEGLSDLIEPFWGTYGIVYEIYEVLQPLLESFLNILLSRIFLSSFTWREYFHRSFGPHETLGPLGWIPWTRETSDTWVLWTGPASLVSAGFPRPRLWMSR